jgi:hypothetical protein
MLEQALGNAAKVCLDELLVFGASVAEHLFYGFEVGDELIVSNELFALLFR